MNEGCLPCIDDFDKASPSFKIVFYTFMGLKLDLVHYLNIPKRKRNMYSHDINDEYL